jgi:hypothetical protein
MSLFITFTFAQLDNVMFYGRRAVHVWECVYDLLAVGICSSYISELCGTSWCDML